MKPRVFIGSSVEGLDTAYAVQENLEYDAEITVWPQGIFELQQYTLESLLKAVASFDFAVLVFSFDDITKVREEETRTVRDNVVFELGLFIGAIGRNRSFIILPRDQGDVHLPTDLIGLTPGTFDANRKDGNIQAALGPTCNRIRKAIKNLGVRKEGQAEQFEPLMAFHESFRGVNWHSLLERAEHQIDIIVYYFDSWVNAYYEALVAFFKRPDTRMRVFVANPDDPELLKNIHRLFPEYSEQVIIEKVAHTGERFAKAAKDAGAHMSRFEFYYVPHFLNYSAQCIDEGVLVLSVFEMARHMKIDSPAFVVDLEKSESLRKYWEKERDGLLSVATRVDIATDG